MFDAENAPKAELKVVGFIIGHFIKSLLVHGNLIVVVW